MAPRHRILTISLAVALSWVLVGCATTSAPPRDVTWLIGRWQGDFSASGIMARVGATGGPVTMTLREDGGAFVSGDIIGAGWRDTTRARRRHGIYGLPGLHRRPNKR